MDPKGNDTFNFKEDGTLLHGETNPAVAGTWGLQRRDGQLLLHMHIVSDDAGPFTVTSVIHSLSIDQLELRGTEIFDPEGNELAPSTDEIFVFAKQEGAAG